LVSNFQKMFLQALKIHPGSFVADIVREDYRTADIFRKYGIEYCCGGKWPIATVCMMKSIEIKELQEELQKASRTIQLPSLLPFAEWDSDFLTDYIINIHHYYLKKTMPGLGLQLNDFVLEHISKYPELRQLQISFTQLQNEIIPHIQYEEDIIFPYIRQIAHAYENKDSYAGLLVKTLRKPVGKLMEHEHEVVSGILYQFRELTNEYTAPEKACTNHRVILSKLKELDNDLVQHIYLEYEILFPRAIAMENELLHP